MNDYLEKMLKEDNILLNKINLHEIDTQPAAPLIFFKFYNGKLDQISIKRMTDLMEKYGKRISVVFVSPPTVPASHIVMKIHGEPVKQMMLHFSERKSHLKGNDDKVKYLTVTNYYQLRTSIESNFC